MRSTNYQDTVITALGHDGFRVDIPNKELSFVFDPFDLKGEQEPADFVFVSHLHFDHCDPTSIKKFITKKTKVIAPNNCRETLAEITDSVVFYEGKDKVTNDKLTYWAIPAYNINKFRTPNEVFHPRELGGVGFIVEVEMEGSKNIRFYHAGDTDFIEEMKEIKKTDVAFLPISGTFVMTLEEAIQAAETIEPDLVIPMHYGKILGSVAEANRYQNLLRDKIQVAVLSTETE